MVEPKNALPQYGNSVVTPVTERGIKMDFTKIKMLANEYADIFISDENKFMQEYEQAVSVYSICELIAIFCLADAYRACKAGNMTRDELVVHQRRIANEYGRARK